MKRSALQCVAGFVGASLIVVGVVWTCQQLSSPTQLNAAQTSQESGLARFTAPQNASATETSPEAPRQLTSRTANGSTTAAKVKAAKEAKQSSARKVRPVSATSQLSLSLVDSEDNVDSENLRLTPAAEPIPTAPALSEFDDSLMAMNVGETASVLDDDQFPGVNAAEPLENDDFPGAADSFDALPSPAPQAPAQPRASRPGSSLSLQDISEDFPQSDQATALPGDDFSASPLTADDELEEAPGALASPLPAAQPAVRPEAPQNFRNELDSAPQQIPSLKGAERVENFFDVKDRKTVDGFINAVLTKQPTPGSSELEGPQTAQIVVEKVVPEEVQTNKSATISIRVKNLGNKAARHILLHDVVPQGVQFVSADQNVAPSPQGDLFWPAFDLDPQREKKFEYTVIPGQEGDFGSVATVLLPVEASCKIKCSRPELKVEASAPESVELGQNVNFEIVVTNVGSGAAYNVALLETIPEGLYHPSGSVLDNKLGVLKAGQSKRLPLTLRSVAQGDAINKLAVSADDCETQEVETTVHVVAPELELGIKGVSNVYLEQSTVFKMTVKNIGDASARGIKLMAQLPESVSFVKANNLGAYKEDEHCVYWDLAELPAQTDGEVELTLRSTKPDKVELVFSASGPNNLTAQATKALSIDGLAALSFNVSSSADLVESGKELEYTIQIVNNGTKASSNVILQILAPEAIAILATDGPSQATNRNGVVVFDRIPEIGPKSSATYKVKASANQAGDCRVGFQLSSDDLDPLVKEVNTRVYE